MTMCCCYCFFCSFLFFSSLLSGACARYSIITVTFLSIYSFISHIGSIKFYIIWTLHGNNKLHNGLIVGNVKNYQKYKHTVYTMIQYLCGKCVLIDSTRKMDNLNPIYTKGKQWVKILLG